MCVNYYCQCLCQCQWAGVLAVSPVIMTGHQPHQASADIPWLTSGQTQQQVSGVWSLARVSLHVELNTSLEYALSLADTLFFVIWSWKLRQQFQLQMNENCRLTGYIVRNSSFERRENADVHETALEIPPLNERKMALIGRMWVSRAWMIGGLWQPRCGLGRWICFWSSWIWTPIDCR